MGKKHLEAVLDFKEAQKHGKELATALGETDKDVVNSLSRIIQYKGLAWAVDCYDATAKVEAEGGMLVPDGSRRRTMGGVFFSLAKKEMTGGERWFIFQLPKDSPRSKK